MKVLHLIDSGGLFGAEMVLLQLIREHAKLGIESVLGSFTYDGSDAKSLDTAADQSGINAKIFHLKKGLDILSALRVAKFAREERFDVIHCHGYKADILMGILPRSRRGVPYLVTFHGWTATKSFSRLGAYGWLDACLAHRAERVVVVTSAMLADPRILWTGLKPSVIPNGIPLVNGHEVRIKDAESTRLAQMRHKGLVIGTICRLSKEKRVDILILALKRLLKAGVKASLVIMGDGLERKRLEGLANSLDLNNSILFTGYVSNASAYLSFFDVFALASLTEGLPITLLEAMRAKVPVVATAVGGIPEALDNGRCGILVSPGSAKSMAVGIAKLPQTPGLREKLVTLANARFQTFYESKRMGFAYMDLYEEMVSTAELCGPVRAMHT